jgi:hypothetical protein
VFDPSTLVRNSNYLVAQQNYVNYDGSGNTLEVQNAVSGQSSSVIMDYSNRLPIAKVSPAAYTDIAYTSFESDGTGNWNVTGTPRNSVTAVTGIYSYDIGSGNITKSGLSAAKQYLFSIWCATGAAVNVNGAPLGNSIASQNGWNLYQLSLSGITTITISGIGLIDELRLHPKNANMSTTTYEPTTGITSTADANNTISYYSYDELHRLKLIRDKDLNIVKKMDYGDTAIIVDGTPNWQSTGLTKCETAVVGNVDVQLKDINPYSSTYNNTKWVFSRNDCTTCKPNCGSDPQYKTMGCNCEAGWRVNISSVRVTVNGVAMWRCFWHYQWDDCTTGTLFQEDNLTRCAVVSGCVQ